MDQFNYKRVADITALSASISEFRYKKHSHNEYALGVTLRGIQQFNLESSFQSSRKNGVMLFNPGQPHDGMSYDKSGIDYVMLYIKPEQFQDVFQNRDVIRFRSPIVYNKELQQKILNLSYAIFNEKDEALCSELLLSLADNFKNNHTENPIKCDALIKGAKEIIHDSSDSVLVLDDISKELKVSKFQFIRLFKTSEGITPYQYFLNCKIEKAKQIIEKTKDVYSAVAECNFVDLSHLTKHFKGIYGITPFEYLSSLKF